MSALRAVPNIAGQVRPLRRAQLALLAGGKSRSRLDVMRAPLRARSAVPFAMICIGVLTASLVAVLVMNTWMVNGSYELARLQRDASRAAQDVQMLHEQVRAAQASLPVRAAEMGMMPAQQPIALDVSSAIVFTAAQMGDGSLHPVPQDATGETDAPVDADEAGEAEVAE